MTKLERVGRRIYLVDLPFAHKDEAKRTLGLTGSNWDAGRRQWFVGLAKKEMAEGLVVRLNMGATQATRSSAKAAEALGLSADTPAAVVADAMSDAGQDAAAARMRASETDEQIDGMAVYAKVRYRGRLWFVVAETKVVTRCRIVGMDRKGPSGGGPEWVDCRACELVRRYESRQVRGWPVRQTLGGLRDFARRQEGRAERLGQQCAECGRARELVRDLEDGMMKCRGCADIPEN